VPELPEVETIKRALEKKIVGQRIKKIEVLSPKQFIGLPRSCQGKKIIKIKRLGKTLLWQLTGNEGLLIHLKVTGQLLYNQSPNSHTRIIIHLEKSAVLFNDQRKFGWMKVIKNLRIYEFMNLGVEPLSKKFTPKVLKKILSTTRRPIKVVLMDQTKIAGIGNIYANEVLWQTKIDPRKPAKQVKKIKELHSAIQKILKAGIKYSGTSAADEAYVRPNGQPGGFQRYLHVYQKEGKPCPRCQTPIKKIKISGRGTFFCPKCQK